MGSETMIAPTRVSFFAISDAMKIIMAEMIIFVTLNIIL
jgi:hypothetical protein